MSVRLRTATSGFAPLIFQLDYCVLTNPARAGFDKEIDKVPQLLSLEQKCIEMIKYGYVVLRQFPRYEKHGLASEIRETMWRTQRLIITALKRHHKKTTLSDLDIEIGLLKRQARVSRELGYLDNKRYHNWIAMLVEMGRMTGGWLRSVRGSKALAL